MYINAISIECVAHNPQKDPVFLTDSQGHISHQIFVCSQYWLPKISKIKLISQTQLIRGNIRLKNLFHLHFNFSEYRFFYYLSILFFLRHSNILLICLCHAHSSFIDAVHFSYLFGTVSTLYVSTCPDTKKIPRNKT